MSATTEQQAGVRAQVRYVRSSAYKAREVLDLIRGERVASALEILEFSERDIARVILKGLESAIANAENNNGLGADELYVSACYADEGPTLKRWRPRARGRATRIRKRTCHITIVVSRLPEDRLAVIRRNEAASTTGRGRGARNAAEARRQRVMRSRQAKAERKAAEEAEEAAHEHDHEHDHGDEEATAADAVDAVEEADDSDAVETDADAVEAVEAEPEKPKRRRTRKPAAEAAEADEGEKD
jgi:large subunit ribosomal protein L22